MKYGERGTARLMGVGALALVATLGVACERRGATEPTDDTPLQLTQEGGDGQSGPAGGVLGQPLRVLVRHEVTEQPVAGVRVRFAAAAGAVLSDTVSTSGLDGVALVQARLGPTQGTGVLIATAQIARRADTRVEFRADVTAPPTLTAISRTSLAGGDTVVVTGTNFNPGISGNDIFFGDVRGRVIAAPEPDQLTAVVPACVPAGQTPVRVAVGSVMTNPIQVSYQATATLLDLQPGEAITITGAQLGDCLLLRGAGARYLIVPQFATDQIRIDTVSYILGSATNTLPVVVDRRAPESNVGLQARFDQALRELEGALARSVPQAMRVLPPQLQQQPPALGTTRTFRVLSSLATSNPTFASVSARLEYSGTRVLLYYDMEAPGGSARPTPAQLEALGRHMDELYPLGVQTFGAESDVDNNGRVIVLMTAVVNRLAPADRCAVDGFVAGFFFGFDLVSTAANSNRGEIYYSVVPDPQGTLSCAHSVGSVMQMAPATFIHEFQHMISFNQHVLVRGGDVEALWLNEALSAIAEEAASRLYEERYPAPLGRTSPAQLFPDSAQGFIGGVLRNSYLYLRDRQLNSVTLATSGATLRERGAGWLFLRWLGDQKGQNIYRQLVQTSRTGVSNVETQTGESFQSLFGDFSMSLITDSIPGQPRDVVGPRHRFHTRNLRQLYQALHDGAVRSGDQSIPTPWPLVLGSLPAGGQVQDRMVPGTADHYILQSSLASASVSLRFTRVDGTPFEPARKAQVGIFRVPQ